MNAEKLITHVLMLSDDCHSTHVRLLLSQPQMHVVTYFKKYPAVHLSHSNIKWCVFRHYTKLLQT